MTLDMQDARQLAVDEAYTIAGQSRADAHTYRWSCPTVELTSLTLGAQAVPIYRIVVTLDKPYRLFSPGGRREFQFQLDPTSGKFVGLKDSGWQE